LEKRPSDAKDYIIYNQGTGALMYDADGNAAIQFATLTSNPSVDKDNFSIVS
jgi:Ca2+-binding RTX toxin-like protein